MPEATAGANRDQEASAPFPDCWLAYGATDAELAAYGAEPPLARGAAGLLLGQLVALVALTAIALSPAPAPSRWLAAVVLVSVLASTVVGVRRAQATAGTLQLSRERLVITPLIGRAALIPWEAIGEIGLASTLTRAAVGLRLRPGALGGDQEGARRGASPLTSGFQYLLYPVDGGAEMLGRVLLRYCVDRKARRRLPTTSVP
jgi:hypothetical protein